MALIHHNALRVNALVPDDDDQMVVLHESGWRQGPHKDTDPDDPSRVPRVLPLEAVDEEPEPSKTKATKATTQKG
jgi:hypothetical protein